MSIIDNKKLSKQEKKLLIIERRNLKKLEERNKNLKKILEGEK